MDRWIVYGKINVKQYFTAKTQIRSRSKCVIRTGRLWVNLRSKRRSINGQPLNSPKLIRFTGVDGGRGISAARMARNPVMAFENSSQTEPLVVFALLWSGCEPRMRPKWERRRELNGLVRLTSNWLPPKLVSRSSGSSSFSAAKISASKKAGSRKTASPVWHVKGKYGSRAWTEWTQGFHRLGLAAV